jgi:hypothetical protein
MQGDITRSTFRPDKHYSSVRMQQGRVQLDADWNEQVEIQQYLDHTTDRDVIGPCGAPKVGGGFAVQAQGNTLRITGGRIYVDGILCENEEQALSLTDQPGLPDFQLPPDPGLYLAYLDVWQRGITPLDDEDIREVALGGADTATRTKVVWQINLLLVDDQQATATCKTDFQAWQKLTGAVSGTLNARAQPQADPPNPCVVPAAAGYRRVENQLYRVEIHREGAVGTATFKWSRENASIETGWDDQNVNDLTIKTPGRDTVLGFAPGSWVELTDDTHLLNGRPGTLVKLLNAEGQVLTIDPTTALGSVQRSDFPLNPRIRRWDEPADSAGELSVEVPATNDGFIPLEDGVEIRFESEAGTTYRTGDYWLIPARTITGDIEWPRNAAKQPIAQNPAGIEHHYCRLALVRLSGEVWAFVDDCRPVFPSLTTICAEDVCFDNTTCQLADVETVQDALERLCYEADLRFHNKHLHGWGVVCGLQVTCGPNGEEQGRTHLTVHSGYAIDCEGNNIRLLENETLDLLQMIATLQQSNPDNPPLDENGNGDVSLILGLDSEFKHRFDIEKFRPRGTDWQSLFAGTLLLDIYKDCIKRIEDFLRDQLTPPEGEKNLPAGPVTQRVAALSNLLALGVNPQTGQRIFISKREDSILREFYDKLREILMSETFCAMFDNARPFPSYPEELTQMDTIFAKGGHERLRVRPGAGELYSVGPGLNPLKPATTINRYDVNRNLLISQIDPIAGVEIGRAAGGTITATDSGAGSVQDVAFSPDGRRIYVIAPTRNGDNTFFRMGEFDGSGNIIWRPIVTICGVNLVTLAVTAVDPANVYAIGMATVAGSSTASARIEGKGLYKINPENVDPNMVPIKAFNSVGHLVITADGRAFATAAGENTAATAYTAIVGLHLPEVTPILPDNADSFPVDAGSDDLALYPQAEGAERDTIYVVSGPSNGIKAIAVYDMNGSRIGDAIVGQDTAIRLQPFPPTRMLLMTLEDDYSVRMIDMQTNQAVPQYLLPMQLSPLAITTDASAERERVYALNYLSNTITTADAGLFSPEFRYPLAALAAYHNAALEAFGDLTANFLQYLKDCICEHLLVNCPVCSEDDKLYLGCISIRKNQVYKICSFTGRKTVGSFPTWNYWLSLVPVAPLIDRLIADFCCLVLPDLFRYNAPAFDEQRTFTARSRVSSSFLRLGMAQLQGRDFSATVGDLFSKGRASGDVLRRILTQPAAMATVAAPVVTTSDIVGQPTDSVEARLKDRAIVVRRAPFDPSRTPDLVSTFLQQPTPGSEVTLHEENGKVVYYSVVRPEPAITDLQAKVTSLSDVLQVRSSAIEQLQRDVASERESLSVMETLKGELTSTQDTLRQRESELEMLRGQLADLRSAQEALARNNPPERVQALEAQLAELRSFNDEVRIFMQRHPPE